MMGIVIAIVIIAIIAIRLLTKSLATNGHQSERALSRKLHFDNLLKQDCRVLSNIYVPKPSGDTAEIDVLYITRKGFLVFENKDYAGYVFGSEENKNWTVTLYAGKTWLGNKKVEKYQFYNPAWQNHTHVKYLKEYLCADVKSFSLITFSDRSSLKKISVNSPDLFVCNHKKLSKVLRIIWRENPDVLTKKQIDEFYDKLLPLTRADKATRQKHIENIDARFGGKNK